MFFSTLEEALTNGYRPCKICMKELWVQRSMEEEINRCV